MRLFTVYIFVLGDRPQRPDRLSNSIIDANKSVRLQTRSELATSASWKPIPFDWESLSTIKYSSTNHIARTMIRERTTGTLCPSTIECGIYGADHHLLLAVAPQ